MRESHSTINSSAVPVVFSEGSSVYEDLARTYKKHLFGLFILAPSGSGKTYFVDQQAEKDWIDGDLLWTTTGADYSHNEWDADMDDVMEINARCDVITHQARKQGFWVLGSSNLFLQPDAVVIPDWETHLSHISSRENSAYDGGAKTHDLEGLKSHIQWITNTWGGKVPFFTSIEEATSTLVTTKEEP